MWHAFDISPAEPIRLGALVRQLKAPGILLQNVSKAESERSIQNWEKPVQDLRITVSTCGGGYPQAIRVDNGSAFILRVLDLWVYVNDVSLNLSRPGSPSTTDSFYVGKNSPVDCFLVLPHVHQQAAAGVPERPLVRMPA